MCLKCYLFLCSTARDPYYDETVAEADKVKERKVAKPKSGACSLFVVSGSVTLRSS